MEDIEKTIKNITMKTIQKFELKQSSNVPHMYVIHNNLTGQPVKQSLKSFNKIKSVFGSWLCSDTCFYFEFLPKYQAAELQQMLPKHRIN